MLHMITNCGLASYFQREELSGDKVKKRGILSCSCTYITWSITLCGITMIKIALAIIIHLPEILLSVPVDGFNPINGCLGSTTICWDSSNGCWGSSTGCWGSSTSCWGSTVGGWRLNTGCWDLTVSPNEKDHLMFNSTWMHYLC